MCIPYRVVALILGAALTGCGGGSLILSDDGSPATLRVESGDGQQAPVGSRLANPLVVKLTDASSRPISGVPVQFKSDVPDSQVDPAEAPTDNEGLASAEVRLGTSTGPHQIEARVASAAQLKATFVVTAVARDPRKKGDGGHND